MCGEREREREREREMKRGRDDDKIMEPMFPRLHVSDREKGGPKAPPRNKMALYEQFSIPSQRSNQGVLPLNPQNTATVVPPPSTTQVSWKFTWLCCFRFTVSLI